MAEYRQYPDPAPHGRHAQRASSQPDAGGQAPRHGAHQQQPQRAPQQRAQTQRPAQPQRTERPAGAQQPQRAARQQAPSAGAPVQQHAPSPQPQRRAPQPQRQAPPPGYPRQQSPQGYRPAQAGAAPATYGVAGNGGGRGGKGKGQGGGKKKGGPWRIVFWAALVVLVVALVALGAIAFSYWQGQNAYDSVAQEVFEPPADIEGAALADITVDWDKLKAINPDTVGWVYIPGTAVNYPIVHTTDDEKYLTTDFNGQQTWGATYGSIFLSAANAADFSDANNIVYGHHLNNGSMFAAITGFDNADQFNAHRTAYVLTPQGNFKLRTFSLVHVAADDPLAQTAFASDEERTAYIQDKIDRSVVTASDVPSPADIAHLFAFATCDNLPSDGRYVLFSYIEESTVPNVAAVGGTDAALDPDAAAAVGDASKEIAA
ncbi:class B sortase [Gordonibacter massiliensis (ex Traore et al. 2017)]|uniref:class B sortase n=1 Tax=Gordonibacter massiliensis (ex Traore et al. 2017) TaxID=1841863 RepID=UPI001C8CB04C|nr:class B sortase [Gordonibacter massiliensis (ex Traore et al. 2017)]MBX9034513.1 class B sortase [Gordonibacter massiliensis (ex Traore et al. 2017)]